MSYTLGEFGIWSSELRECDLAEAVTACQELETLGFGCVWMPARGRAVFDRLRRILEATTRIVVATGVVSIWTMGPGELVVLARPLLEDHPDRLLIGLGAGHAEIVNESGTITYERPLDKLRGYLGALDALEPTISREHRVLAALGPRLLTLAAGASLGAHPYLVPPDHTRWARRQLGTGPILAVEQGVVLETDASQARVLARQYLGRYLGLGNYVSNFLRSGFSEADLAGGGSDAFVDGIIAWGDAETVVARADEHLAAGADHVCFQVVPQRARPPQDDWRALARALRLRA